MKRAILLSLLISAACYADTIFLDDRTEVVNGSMAYDPAARTCGNGSHEVYTGIASAMQALKGGDTLYIRAGTYSRLSVGKYKVVHGNKVNYWMGVLDITASGTSQQRTLVSAYKGEPVIIQAKQGVNHYNPDPADTSFKNSSHYYSNPAIGIHGAYIDVTGLKTYGQVVISGHDIALQDCDLGGGGPHMNQGQVIALNGTGKAGVYNVLIRNNKVHHSCWGESTGNGAALMGYDFSCIIENNGFYDNFGPDIAIKDTGGQEGRKIVVRHNFFRPTSVNPSGNAGIHGHNQDCDVDSIYICHNIFLHKSAGISFRTEPRLGHSAYNNTFVNCGYGRGEVGDVGDWLNPRINVYNNLYYHSRPDQKFYDIQTKPWDKLSSDYNLFFSATGDTQWRHLYRNRCSSLAAWQHYSGKDEHSVEKDPGFVNPAGNRPEDFRRKGKPNDVTDSPYGSVCGAYVTGSEVIGTHIEPKRQEVRPDQKAQD